MTSVLPPNVHHQPIASFQRQCVRDTGIDKPGLFTSRNDFYGMPQCIAGAFQKALFAARAPQCTGPDNAYTVRVDISQALTEALEAGQRTRRHVLVQPAFIVNARGKLHHFTQSVDDDELPVAVSGNHQMETIGTQINSGQNIWHTRRTPAQALLTPRMRTRSRMWLWRSGCG
jgi:hypothetical protein